MSRKSLLLAFGLLLLVGCAVAGAVTLMVLHQPDYYRRVTIPPGPQRQKWSRDFNESVTGLLNGIINKDKTWGARFTDQQINSYLEEDFLRLGPAERSFFPSNISDPRVAIEGDRIRLGFRYGKGRWSTVVSIDLRIWLARGTPNVVALEVQSMRVGSLPIAMQSILERFAEGARQRDIEMSWYRREGKPVALLKFGPGRREPSVQLLQVKLQPGTLTVHGKDNSQTGIDPLPGAAPPAGKSAP